MRSFVCCCFFSGSPVKVDLDGPATMIACGDFHTVVLMATGEVVTFGDYKVRRWEPLCITMLFFMLMPHFTNSGICV